MHKFSYILGYRYSASVYREKNLKTVLNWLNNDFKKVKFEIVLVEQDCESKIGFSLPSNCKHVFVYNNSHYNRSWSFNVGANLSSSNIVIFADCDLLIKSSELLASIEECNGEFDAINPKGKVIAMYADEKNYFNPQKFEIRKGINFSGGICIMKKNKFFDIFGWDEDMTGWGGEDDLMTHKIKKMLNKIKCTGFNVYHLFHTSTSKNQEVYKENLKILKKIMAMEKEELIQYYKNRKIGQVDKFLL